MRSVFVVGSKPEAVFPDCIEPDVVYAANGALDRVQKYAKTAKIISVLSSYILSSEISTASKTRDIIAGSAADKVVLLTNSAVKRDISLESLDIKYHEMIYISPRDRTKLVANQVGYYSSIRQVYRDGGLRSCIAGIYNFMFGRSVQPLKISSGLLGMAIELASTNSAQDIHLVGIGLNANSGHFYDANKSYGRGHIDVDRFYLNVVAQRFSTLNLSSDDSSISNVFNTYA